MLSRYFKSLLYDCTRDCTLFIKTIKIYYNVDKKYIIYVIINLKNYKLEWSNFNMTPLEEIYDLLNKKLNLSKEEIDKAVETNIYLKKVIAPDVFQVIKKFEEFGLEDKEIAEIAKQNPWMLTESFERINYLKNFYKLAELTDYKELLIKQPIAMSVNPIKIKELIEKFQEQGKTNEEIRNILINDFTEHISL